MKLSAKMLGQVYRFESLKEVMAKANEEKSGDKLAGVAARSAAERIAAKSVLSHVTLEELRKNPAVPYEDDEVTRIIEGDVNEAIYGKIKSWTVSELREFILDDRSTPRDLRRIGRGLTSEMVAATAKLMSNLDLIYGASQLPVTAHCNTRIGEPGTLASRLQPNHPTDSVEGIMASIREGLSFGVGDAVIGINPVEDNVENTTRILKVTNDFMEEWGIPTQNCVLAHVTTQAKAIEEGAPSALVFQSLAGSESGNKSFGIDSKILDEAWATARKKGTATGPNVMYFETGQGSELSSNSHHGADQVTMEARCYGLARHYQPFLVNTVVGFIGPEYLYDSKQVIRAGLEDHFMGKLTGVPMGVDACYTNHMKADQNDIENLAVLLGTAGCNYFMGIPMGDDCMLNYQCTSFHDTPTLRQLLRLKPIAEFQEWLQGLGLMKDGKLTEKAGDASFFSGAGPNARPGRQVRG